MNKKKKIEPDFTSHVHMDELGSIDFNFYSIDNTDDFENEISISRNRRMCSCLFLFSAKISKLCD